jgi:serine/threonine protein phosphatase 1
MTGRTFAIGDIHGDSSALDAALAKLPERTAEDTLVFLGDYVDRGPDSRGVIERVRELSLRGPAKVVALRGNHEDAWVQSYFESPHVGFLLPEPNGAGATYRSLLGKPGEGSLENEELAEMLNVKKWFPPDVAEWMKSLPYWHEDEHAIYVHAGLDGEGVEWKHPSEGRTANLLWMREPDFFERYAGKRLVFGHTITEVLPTSHMTDYELACDDPGDVWQRGDLIGLDTGCGKGGYLSIVELPSLKLYDSRIT